MCLPICSVSLEEDDPVATSAATGAEGTSTMDGKGGEGTATDESANDAVVGSPGTESVMEGETRNEAQIQVEKVSEKGAEGTRTTDEEETDEPTKKKATKEEKAAERILKANM